MGWLIAYGLIAAFILGMETHKASLSNETDEADMKFIAGIVISLLWPVALFVGVCRGIYDTIHTKGDG